MKGLNNKNPRKNDGGTPLHIAAYYGKMEICRLICQNIVDTNPMDDVGNTPISNASAMGHFEIVSFLKNLQSMEVD